MLGGRSRGCGCASNASGVDRRLSTPSCRCAAVNVCQNSWAWTRTIAKSSPPPIKSSMRETSMVRWPCCILVSNGPTGAVVWHRCRTRLLDSSVADGVSQGRAKVNLGRAWQVRRQGTSNRAIPCRRDDFRKRCSSCFCRCWWENSFHEDRWGGGLKKTHFCLEAWVHRRSSSVWSNDLTTAKSSFHDLYYHEAQQ